jgi:hypothetical protein
LLFSTAFGEKKMNDMKPHRVGILGGGFGGLYTTLKTFSEDRYPPHRRGGDSGQSRELTRFEKKRATALGLAEIIARLHISSRSCPSN